ncbi:MAG: hypothetical protein K2I00_11035 [Ruminococcus sp.]|nr:hypothetical protein [Ruminococcus sp.]
MGRNRIEKNPLSFKKGYFLLLAQQKLTPCEFRCLLVLAEGEERTKAQVAVILSDTPQHVGTAMIHLEKLGLITNTRIEGRNSFFKISLDINPECLNADPNQLTI